MPDPDDILPVEAWTDFSGRENWSETLKMRNTRRTQEEEEEEKPLLLPSMSQRPSAMSIATTDPPSPQSPTSKCDSRHKSPITHTTPQTFHPTQ